MSVFDETVNIAAPVAIVWRELKTLCEQSEDRSFENGQTLLISREDDVYHVFILELQANKTTLLRYLLTRSFSALSLPSATDMAQALATLPKDVPDTAISAASERLRQIQHGASTTATDSRLILTKNASPSANAIPEGLQSARPPFAPIWLILSGLGGVFFVTFGTGIIAAVNWRRFGKPRTGLLTLLLTLGIVMIFTVLYFNEILPGRFPVLFVDAQKQLTIVYQGKLPEDLLSFMLVNAIVGIAFSGIVVLWQRSAYIGWKTSHSDVAPSLRESGMGFYMLALLLAPVLGYLLVFYTMTATSSLFTASQPDTVTFTSDNLSLAYPGGWAKVDFDPTVCSHSNTQCLLAIVPPDPASPMTVELVRFQISTTDMQTEESAWEQIKQQSPGLVTNVGQQLLIDKRHAVERIFTDYTPGHMEKGLWIFIQDQDSIIRFYASCDPACFDRYRDSINAMVRSIHFTGDTSVSAPIGVVTSTDPTSAKITPTNAQSKIITFTSDNLSLAYPQAWLTLYFNPSLCSQTGIKCLLGLVPEATSQGDVDLIRILFSGTAEQMDESAWKQNTQQSPGLVVNEHKEIQIDNHHAVERIFTNGDKATVLWIFIEDKGSIVRFYASCDADCFRRYRDQIDAIVGSIRLTGN